MLKRFLIPPILPVILIVLLSIWVFADETQSAPRIIDGRPDNAPSRASVILFIMTPIFYIPFGILNLIDSIFDRFTDRIRWAGSIGISIFLSVLLSNIFYRPDIDSSPFPGVGIAIIIGFMMLIPMSLIRRWALSPRKEVSRLPPDPSVSFETLFPNAEAAPIMKKTEQGGETDG